MEVSEETTECNNVELTTECNNMDLPICIESLNPTDHHCISLHVEVSKQDAPLIANN